MRNQAEILGNGATVRFGRFTLDTARRQLTKDGAPVHVTPKAFDLLMVLASEAPRVVTKTELHERLWPATYVSESTLSGLVKELRRSFGDSDPAWPIIRTAHGIGYAFCAELDDDARAQQQATCRWLVCRGEGFPLRAGANVIGRDPASDVWLDAAGVSRRHARIVIDREAVRIEDLGSKNGTTVGGTPVHGTTTLRDGDRITFGQIVGVYRSSTAGMSTETASRKDSAAKTRSRAP